MALFSEITENIKVSVRPLYLESESNVLSRKFVFAYFLTIENLGDARIETGRSVDGLVNTGTPRLALAGFRCVW